MPDTHSKFSANQNFSAQACHQGQNLHGKLSVSFQSVVFEHASGSIELPLENLSIRMGGHNDEQIFFEHPSESGSSIFTSDRRILEHSALQQHPHLKTAFRAVRKRRNAWAMTLTSLSVLLLLLLVAIGVLINQRKFLARYFAFKVPASWEQNLGETVYRQIELSGKIVHDSQLSSQLEKASAPLVQAASHSGYQFQFHLLEDNTLNAFALPGGHIVVHTALLKSVSRPEELSGVLAHEIAHVTERHSLRQMVDKAGLWLLIQALLGDSSGLFGMMTEGSQFLLQQQFSRDFEREADDAGWNYLIAANIDPRGMIDFFKKMKAQGESPGSLDFMSTHPSSDERIQRLEEKWKKLERKSGFIELK